MTTASRWDFEHCRDRLATLPGRLGFPEGHTLSFLGLRLDLATGVLVTEPDNLPLPGLRPTVFCILDAYSRVGEIAEAFQPVPFDQLPDGTAYAAAFRNRAILPLAGQYSRDSRAFVSVMQAFGAVPVAYADHAWILRALPRVPVYILVWEGSGEFPPSADLLFDASVSSILPTEAAAMLGELVADRIASVTGL